MTLISFLGALIAMLANGVSGVVTAAGPGGEPFRVPGVEIQLLGSAGEVTASTVSDSVGEYRFESVPDGVYTVRAELPGFEAFEQALAVTPEAPVTISIQLELARVQTSVEVSAEGDILAPDASSVGGRVGEDSIAAVPLAEESFLDTLPLVPGTVRGPDGLINVSGGRSNESDLRVNDAAAVDPVTGEYGFRLPIDAVESVETLTNPYAAEYGNFSSGVTEIRTRPGGDDFHFEIHNFLPRGRRREGSIVGVGSATPRMLFSGPLGGGNLHYVQSLEYRFVRTEVEAPTLPQFQRDTIVESFDSFTQLDYDIAPQHRLSAMLSVSPKKNGFVGLDTFNPEEVTHDLRQRGVLFTAAGQSVLGESVLESLYSVKPLDANVIANGAGTLFLAPERNFGGFFNTQDRDSTLQQWRETYSLAPFDAKGRHLLKIGGGVVHTRFDGRDISGPVEVLSAAGRLRERLEFSGAGELHRTKTDVGLFFQDTWNPRPGVTLDVGVRYDRDGEVDESNVSPRAGFALSPWGNGRTVLRGGFGLFYGRVPINVTVFDQMQQRTVTRFGAGGELIGVPVLYRNRTHPEGLRTPYSGSATLEIGQQIGENLTVRVGVQQRNGRRGFVVDPVEDALTGSLVLASSGSSRYRELSVTATYRAGEKHDYLFSYVRSRTTGDLNDFNLFFGNDPNPVIRPNERAVLAFDAPHRFIFWGTSELPWGLTVAPVVDIRTGFPYSAVDEGLDFVGRRNTAGRFPAFFSMDLQVLKWIRIPKLGKRIQVGIRVFNLTNHYNPRNIQNNLASANFGQFSNGVDREIRGRFSIDF